MLAEKNGGKTELRNLRPICNGCNSLMGTKHMVVFMFDSDYIMNDLFMHGIKRNDVCDVYNVCDVY